MIELSPTTSGTDRVDVFIGCVGYEHRSVEALRNGTLANSATQKLLFSYESIAVHSFDRNLNFVKERNCSIQSNFDEFLQDISSAILAIIDCKVAIDVTSLDRKKLANIIDIIFSLQESISSVTILYYPRQYTEPSAELEEVLQFGPVSAKFVGEASYEREYLSLIVGAGYEFGRVVGAIDVLEPEVTYCLIPSGPDPRFEEAVMKNNQDFRFLDDPSLILRYEVERPDQLFYALRRLIEVETRVRNVLILPLGPKIFAAISIIVALIYHPSVMVWRHSTVDSMSRTPQEDAKASGHVCSFSFSFI